MKRAASALTIIGLLVVVAVSIVEVKMVADGASRTLLVGEYYTARLAAYRTFWARPPHFV